MKAIRLPILAAIMLCGANPGQSKILYAKAGDKLLDCRLEHLSKIDQSKPDIPPNVGSRVLFLLPIVAKGEFGYREKREAISPLKMALIDKESVLGTSNISVVLDEEAFSGFLLGMAVGNKPVMLAMDPNQRKDEAYFTTVVDVDRLTMKPKDADGNSLVGWCELETGPSVAAKFEALK